MNQPTIQVHGRVTRKGATEAKTKKGKAVVRLTIGAQVERARTAGGEGQPERTTPWWLRLLVFNEEDRAAAMRLQRGDIVWVHGRVSREPWTDKDGKRREEWTVVVDRLYAMLPVARYAYPTDDGPEDVEGAHEAEAVPEEPPTEPSIEYEQPPEPIETVA